MYNSVNWCLKNVVFFLILVKAEGEMSIEELRMKYTPGESSTSCDKSKLFSPILIYFWGKVI